MRHQCDEDDYGYESNVSRALFEKIMSKYDLIRLCSRKIMFFHYSFVLLDMKKIQTKIPWIGSPRVGIKRRLQIYKRQKIVSEKGLLWETTAVDFFLFRWPKLGWWMILIFVITDKSSRSHSHKETSHTSKHSTSTSSYSGSSQPKEEETKKKPTNTNKPPPPSFADLIKMAQQSKAKPFEAKPKADKVSICLTKYFPCTYAIFHLGIRIWTSHDFQRERGVPAWVSLKSKESRKSCCSLRKLSIRKTFHIG